MVQCDFRNLEFLFPIQNFFLNVTPIEQMNQLY